MNNNKIRLNPFVYISETDVRFYLLVLIGIIMPTIWALIFGIVIFYVMAGFEITLFLRLLILIPILSFIPFLIYRDYKRFPQKIIKKSKLKKFDKEKYPEHQGYIEKLHEQHLSTQKKPALMVQPMDTSKSAFTFGTKSHIFIGIPGGLIKMFRGNINSFGSIFLHEIGHIVNKDVEKTYLANSTFRSLFITLSIPFGIVLLYEIYLVLSIFYLANSTGYDMDYISSEMNLGRDAMLFGRFILYFLIFLGIIYVLRNQIIRIREFYADAKVLEWEGSSEKLVKALEESGGEQYSRFEILKKFHPNVNERIQVLKNNLSLFNPDLWVAFSIGFFFGLIEIMMPFFNLILSLSSSDWSALTNPNYQPIVEAHVLFRAMISIFIIPILILPVNSSFHKAVLKDVFIYNKKYFSFASVRNLIKFSLVFSLGWLTSAIMSLSTIIFDINTLIILWLALAFDFLIVLLYIMIFSAVLIRRSFNKKEAVKNFLMVSALSSILYLINRYYFVETLHNRSFLIIFFLIFLSLTYIFIKMKDKKLYCPSCDKKTDLSVIRMNCPGCQQELYPWAIYPFV